MNRSQLDALLAEKVPAPVSKDNLKASYAYLVGLQTAEEVDLDELKAHLDSLTRMKARLSDDAVTAIGQATQAIVDRADFPEKLRGRVESFKRVVWGLHSDVDPFAVEFAKQVKALDNAETRDAAAKWLKENRDLLPAAPVVEPEKLSLE